MDDGQKKQGLVITNSLTGKKEPFQPIHPPQVRMYVCGPTVYDDPHIGHIRGAFVFDMIRKYLRHKKFEVKFIRNVTDIDDKIIEKARSEKSEENLKQACERVTLKYTNAYHGALEKLAIDPPDEEPKATEQIPKMIEMIQHLIGKGMAYAAEGNVYLSVNRFKEYGKLSHQNPEQLIKGHRMEPGPGKKDPLDFALWKNAKEDEPWWESPWGRGRPGWHIECSVMSQAGFGETLDIHGGGVDLVFPHHENEIAQSEAAWEKPFASYWLHNGLLTVEGQKMSKSVGNVVGVKEILEKGYHPDDLKFFFLRSHYRSPVDFSWQRLNDAKQNRISFEIFFTRCEQSLAERNVQLTDDVLKSKERFESAMDDDFNTPRALAVLFEMLQCGYIYLASGKISGALEIKEELRELKEILGLSPTPQHFGNLPSAVKTLIAKRDELRKAKDFQAADRIRKQLDEMGYIIEDGEKDSTWRTKQ